MLAWIIALGVLANVAAISPLGDRAAHISSQIHLTVHVFIFAASVVVGAGVRDLARARPWSLPIRLLVGALGLAGVVATVLPPLDASRDTRHVILVIAGGAMGFALRDALLARGARCTSGMHEYAPEVYVPSSLAWWIETGRRQEAKDRVLLPRLARTFLPGRVLELGAGAGQTSLILRDLGWEVVASDYAPFFVAHLQSLGLCAHQVDATDISASGLGAFPNIFCQSITPLITSDVGVIARTYRSLYGALEPGGRMVEIHAQAARHELRSTMRMHAEQAHLAGFADVRVARNQLLPSLAYRGPLRPVAAYAELLLGRSFGNRFILTAQRPHLAPGNARRLDPSASTLRRLVCPDFLRSPGRIAHI
ncbi:MAG TPA: class I SAM-dependent methyltransferase [Gaiellales bacterium]|nr:class I SAM-dependent methyltransferase [Gaiellales bacterium]